MRIRCRNVEVGCQEVGSSSKLCYFSGPGHTELCGNNFLNQLETMREDWGVDAGGRLHSSRAQPCSIFSFLASSRSIAM